MKTEIIKINKENLEKLDKPGKIIREGGLVAFPTETVYGLGADGLNPEAVKEIFKVKGRPQDNPLILHVCDLDMLKKLVKEIPEKGKILIDEFWPGPLTIIFRKSDLVPEVITAGLDTVAIRMPEDVIAKELIRISGKPIAAPSANISGRPSPTDGKTTYEDLKGKIPMIIDGGNTKVGVESTVIDLTSDKPMILRPGGITLEMIRKLLPEVTLDQSILKEGEIPKSPGQKYKHYAPKADCFIVTGDDEEKIKLIEEYVEDKEELIGLMLTDELYEKINLENVDKKSMGSRDNENLIASRIFRLLRNFDKDKVSTILIEGLDEKNLGLAIMNRLKKASGNKFLKEEIDNENSSRQ